MRMARIAGIFKGNRLQPDRLRVDRRRLRRVSARIRATVGEYRRREEIVEGPVLLDDYDHVTDRAAVDLLPEKRRIGAGTGSEAATYGDRYDG